ncbi:MAG: ABC transporter permease, partial [Verrucomicrobiales bacterium]|nr:ABC transporter permease [Verrucomicrobiales bacterium]
MRLLTLIRRSLVFHRRSHAGVVIGAAIGSAALIGALVVGDSVRRSLVLRAEERVGTVEVALDAGDRWFGADLGGRLEAKSAAIPKVTPKAQGNPDDTVVWGGTSEPRAAVIALRGSASAPDGSARAHEVRIYGVPPGYGDFSPREGRRAAELKRAFLQGRPMPAEGSPEAKRLEQEFWEKYHDWRNLGSNSVRLNRALAAQLSAKPGDTVVLRFAKPSAVSQDAVLSPRNEATVALRLQVKDIVDGDRFGDFALRSGSSAPMNAFLEADVLATAAGVTNRANLLLLPGGSRQPTHVAWKASLARWRDRARNWLPRSLMAVLDRGFVAGLLGPSSPPAPTEDVLRYVRSELDRRWRLEDAEIEVRVIEEPASRTGGVYVPPMIEVGTRRIFLDEAVGRAAVVPRTRLLRERVEFGNDEAKEIEATAFVTNGVAVTTYLANGLRAGEKLAPYSMVTAAGAPWTPSDLRDDEIVVNTWLAADLGVRDGDRLEMTYYDPEAGARLVEKTNVFTIRGVVPVKGVHADRTLMPEFPGLSKAESTKDWDAGFPLVHAIRDQDEAYWKTYRGTPKAFVTPAAGRAMWANRFGSLTAVRYPLPAGTFASGYRKLVEANLLANLAPGDVGLSFRAVRSEAMRAAASGQDFGGLFVGFSFFLVIAALLLMSLLFRFGLEQRLPEVGTLLAVGFPRRLVRRLWWGEASGLAAVGGVLGVAGGLGYAWAMMRGLGTIWRDAVAGTPLMFHVTPRTLVIGVVAAMVVCVLTLAATMRRTFRRAPRELLAGTPTEGKSGGGKRGFAFGVGAWAAALGLAGWAVASGRTSDPGVFFGAGSLVLMGGLGLISGALRRMQGSDVSGGSGARSWSAGKLALRGTARRRSRSLATVG